MERKGKRIRADILSCIGYSLDSRKNNSSCEKDLNIEKPKQTFTFTFDTETFLYLDGKKLSQNEVLEKLK